MLGRDGEGLVGWVGIGDLGLGGWCGVFGVGGAGVRA